MNDRRENKLSRNKKVETYYVSHGPTLSAGAPALTTHVSQFNGKTAECVGFAMEADEDITGASTQKTYLKNLMRDYALAVSGALYSHFLIIKDFRAAKKAYLTKSEIDNARDTDAYVICKRVLEQGQANSADILPLGITALTLTDFETALDNYWDYVQEPQDERSERTAALQGFDRAMAESEEILEIIKGIMLTQKTAFPELYTHFLGAIAIDDNVGGGTPSEPDFEFTVLPGAFYTAVSLPFIPSRRFIATNLAPEALNWGLSDVETSFTSPAIVLDANSTSNLLSTTLGVSGSFLIFENPTASPIQVELTVVDE